MSSLAENLKKRKEQSKKRKILLAQFFKLKDPRKLDRLCKSKYEIEEKRKRLRDISRVFSSKSGIEINVNVLKQSSYCNEEPVDVNEEHDKEKVYTDSSAFLKGTQSANPHNDYCQHFVDTGERPQNFIRDVGLTNRFEEYPKLRELILKKDHLIQQTNTPPMYLKCDLETFDLCDLDCKFDVILLEPPLEEYQRTLGVTYDKFWSWDEIEKLAIDQIAAPRSFIWIWCGSSDGLDAARKCLKKWGYRRCEDICWIKTNIKNPGHKKNLETKAIFQRTKEHCLMGIKGTVRRSTDGDFIHANVDIDLVIEEEPQDIPDEKPMEIFHIIEHFCLGRRRLHLFGKDTSVRPGWLTMGPRLTSSNFDPEVYSEYFMQKVDGHLTGCTEDIERLRPKSPPPKNATQQQQLSSNAMLAAGISGVAAGVSSGLPPTAIGMMPGSVMQVAGMNVLTRDIVAGATAIIRNGLVAAAQQQQLTSRLAPPPRSIIAQPRNVMPSHLMRIGTSWQPRQAQSAIGVQSRPWMPAMPLPR